MRPLRVWDSDFVRNNGLVTLAHQVAMLYNGNWREMIEYKRLAASSVLDEKQARSVLNMALSDSAQCGVWPEIRDALALSREVDAASLPPAGYAVATSLPADNAWVKRRKLHLVEPPQRRGSIDLAVRFKTNFGSPYQRNGAIHIIDHEASYCRWSADWDKRLQDYDYEHRTPRLYVYWECGRWAQSKIVLFATPHNHERALCTKCFPIQGPEKP